MYDFTSMHDSELWALREGDDRPAATDALYELAMRAFRRDRHREAAAMFEMVAGEYDSSGAERPAGTASYWLGRALVGAGDTEPAAEAFGASAASYLESGTQDLAADSLYWRASSLLNSCHFAESLIAADSSLAIAVAEGMHFVAGRASHVRASALARLNRVDEALSACERSRELLRSCPEVPIRDLLEVEDEAVSILLDAGQGDEAVRVARRCLALADSGASVPPGVRARHCRRLADALFWRGDYADAEATARLAVDRYAQVDDPRGLAMALATQAEALFALDDEVQRCLEPVQKAAALFEVLGDEAGHFRCSTVQSLALAAMGRLDEAIALERELLRTALTSDADSLELARASACQLVHLFVDANRMEDATRAAADLAELWLGHGAGLEDDDYRSMMASAARAEHALGNTSNAAQIASDVLMHARPCERSTDIAYMVEYKAEGLLAWHHEEAAWLLGRALALHLELGNTEHAREVAQVFLRAPGNRASA